MLVLPLARYRSQFFYIPHQIIYIKVSLYLLFELYIGSVSTFKSFLVSAEGCCILMFLLDLFRNQTEVNSSEALNVIESFFKKYTQLLMKTFLLKSF